MGQVESVADRTERVEVKAAVRAQQRNPDDAETQPVPESVEREFQKKPHKTTSKSNDGHHGKDAGDPPGRKPNDTTVRGASKPTAAQLSVQNLAKAAAEAKSAAERTKKYDKNKDASASLDYEPSDTPKNFHKVQAHTTHLPDMTPTANPPNRNYVREEAIAPLYNLYSLLQNKLQALRREHALVVTERDDLRIERSSSKYERLRLRGTIMDKYARCKELEKENAVLLEKLEKVRPKSASPGSLAGEKRKHDEVAGGQAVVSTEGHQAEEAGTALPEIQYETIVETTKPDEGLTSKKRRVSEEVVTPGLGGEEASYEPEEETNNKKPKSRAKREKKPTPPVAIRVQPARKVRKDTLQ